MFDRYELKENLRLIIWILTAGKPGREVLDLLVEVSKEIISSCFLVLDQEVLDQYVRSEIAALLWEIGTGKRKIGEGFATFLYHRYLRLTANLLKAEAISQGDMLYFSEIERHLEKSAEDELEKWLYSMMSDEAESLPPEKQRDPHLKGLKGRLKGKTLKRLHTISRIEEFRPGCIEVRSAKQLNLF